MAKKPKEPKAPRTPKVKKKRSARSRFGYFLLVLGTVLGVAAGVSYAVPIPGLTAAVKAATTVKDPSKQATQPTAATPSQTATDGASAAELTAREDAVKQKESEVSALLKDLTQHKADLDPIQKAAAMYENMPPYKAGPILQAMDPVAAAKILKLMDEDQAGAIISYMDQAKGAQVMTELLKPPAPKPPGN